MLAGVGAGCGSGDDGGDAASDGPAAADDGAPDGSGAPSGGESGGATLVVGDQTYQVDNFVCAFGYSSTQSETFSFSSSNLTGEIDGVGVQLQLDVEDPSGGDRLTGDGVNQRIHLDDIEDFESPSVSVSSNEVVAVFEGDDISAEGTFFDAVADPNRAAPLPGTFEATCGAGSRR